MNPTQVAQTSFRTIWNNKSLWLFGFFVVASGGGAGARGKQTHLPGSAASAASDMPQWLWAVIALAVVLGIISVLMHVLSEGALIDGVRKANAQPVLPLTVASGWSSGRKNFGRVFGVKALVGTVFLAALAVMLAPALLGIFGIAPVAIAIALTIPLALLAVPVLLSLHFINEFAIRIAVLDDVGVIAAISRARAHLNGRVIDSVKLMLLSFAGQMAGGVAAFVCLLPGALIGALVYFVGGMVPGLVAFGIVSVPLAAAALGATGAFRSTVWTLGFLQGRAEELS